MITRIAAPCHMSSLSCAWRAACPQPCHVSPRSRATALPLQIALLDNPRAGRTAFRRLRRLVRARLLRMPLRLNRRRLPVEPRSGLCASSCPILFLSYAQISPAACTTVYYGPPAYQTRCRAAVKRTGSARVSGAPPRGRRWGIAPGRRRNLRIARPAPLPAAPGSAPCQGRTARRNRRRTDSG